MHLLCPQFLYARFGLQDAVGHGFQSNRGDVLGQVVQGLALDRGGLTECRGHPDEACAAGPRVWKTLGVVNTEGYERMQFWLRTFVLPTALRYVVLKVSFIDMLNPQPLSI